jgi:uncharacterized protein (DUF1501 family)
MTGINRRLFLKSSAIGLAALSTGGVPRFVERLAAGVSGADAAIKTRRKSLVAIFQRGGMDGLMAVSPLADDGLRELRPRLEMGRETDNRLFELDARFGLHPAFEPLLPMFRDRTLAIVHGAGSPNTTRSHFDAQDYMETGTPFRKGTPTGWLNRALVLSADTTPPNSSPFRAIALSASLPRSLYGDLPALAVADLTRFGLVGGRKQKYESPPARGFESLYEQTSQEILRDTGGESFEAIHTLAEMDVREYRPAPGVDYPSGRLGTALMQIAYLVKAGVGLDVAFAESNGWDTHVQQGTANGAFASRARNLSASINAFWTDLGRFRDDVVLMTMTEFGRTVHQNGSGGTDHGRGSCLFVLGASVDGGTVYGSVPALRRDNLEDGRDLPVTTDFRSVFAEVAGHQFGLADDRALFPGWEGERLRLFRG